MHRKCNITGYCNPDTELVEMGYDVIETFGIAFYKKNCDVLCGGECANRNYEGTEEMQKF